MTSRAPGRRIRPAIILSSVATILLMVAVSYVYLLLAGRIDNTRNQAQCTPSPNDSLIVRASLPKNTFTQGEDIPISIYLVNRTDRVLWIPRSLYAEKKLETVCRDSYRHALRPLTAPRQAFPWPSDSLLPGDSTLTSANLAADHGASRFEGARFFMHPTGQYTAQVYLEERCCTEEMPYLVNEPTAEDLSVLSWLASHRVRFLQPQLREHAPAVEELLEEHQSSAYVPQLMQLLMEYYDTDMTADNVKVAYYGKLLAELNANRTIGQHWFNRAMERMSPDEGYALALRTERDYPGTVIGKTAAVHRLRLEASVGGKIADSLAFRMYLDKSEYLLGETVWLHLFIINLTNDTLDAVLPDYDTYQTVELHVVDSSGNELRRTTGVRFPPRIYQQKLLLPHDTLLGLDDVSFCCNQRPFPEIWHVSGQLPGSYTVHAEYCDRMTAAIVRYSVVEPKGSEAEAFAQYRAVAAAAEEREWASSVSHMENLLRNFPRSVYAAQALALIPSAFRYAKDRNTQGLIEYSKQLIIQYPDYPGCGTALGDVLANQTVAENRAYLRNVAESKPGTWAARIARRRLISPDLERISTDGLQRGYRLPKDTTTRILIL